MNKHHIELVRDVLTRTVNGAHVDPQEYGLALLACDEALAEPDLATAWANGYCWGRDDIESGRGPTTPNPYRAGGEGAPEGNALNAPEIT